MLNSQETHAHLIETSYSRLNQEKSHFSNTGKILLKQEFSMGYKYHEHKRYYCLFDNSLLFTGDIQNTTQIFPR